MALSDTLSEIDALLKEARENYSDTWEANIADLEQARCNLLTARMRLENPPGIPQEIFQKNPIYVEAMAGNIDLYDDVMDEKPEAMERMAAYGALLQTKLTPGV
jgi:hypothetical protein